MTDTTTAVRIDVVSGPTPEHTVADFELFYARRALRRLKHLLGRQAMLTLLADDLDAGNTVLRDATAQSDGRLRPATTVLAVSGMTARDFVDWLDANMSDEATMLAAQPEHYVMDDRAQRGVLLVENFGPLLCSSVVSFGADDGWAAGTPEFLPESDYPIKKIATMRLEDGTPFGRVLSQFGDTADGFSASLSIYFPDACPEELFEHHRRHLAVEFSNWITAAAASHRSEEQQ